MNLIQLQSLDKPMYWRTKTRHATTSTNVYTGLTVLHKSGVYQEVNTEICDTQCTCITHTVFRLTQVKTVSKVFGLYTRLKPQAT